MPLEATAPTIQINPQAIKSQACSCHGALAEDETTSLIVFLSLV